MKKASDGQGVPSFADIDHDAPIGDVYPSAANDEASRGRGDRASREVQVASVSHPSIDGPIRPKRHRCRRRGQPGSDDDHDDGRRICDPSAAHVRMGSIVVPVEMTLPNAEEVGEIDGAAPAYSINQSRVSLYAAFPPPPITIRPQNSTGEPVYDESALKNVRRYSGFHGAVGVTSATGHAEGYSDTMLSLNYRLPSLLSLPTQLQSRRYKTQQRLFIGNMHCNLLLGSTNKTCLGSTLSTLDGRTHVRWDVGSPFYHLGSSNNSGGRTFEGSGIVLPSPQSTHTLSASRLFSLASNPLRVGWTMHLSPLPPLVFQPMNTAEHQQALTPLHLRHCNVTLSTVDRDCENEWEANNPKVSLRLGYGTLTGVEGCMHQLRSDIMDASIVGDRIEGGAANSASLKLDVEQRISTSQSCRTTLEYRQSGQVLSLSTLAIRTFASSVFSKLGVGVRYSLDNLFRGGSWWSNGNTCWLFQLERGDVRFVIPVTVVPRAATAWNSLVRLSYASLASLVVDVIMGELLCEERSKLRLAFLRFILGKEKVARYVSTAEDDDELTRKGKDDLLRKHLCMAQEESARQVQLMTRQARSVTSREAEQGGLVVVKAIYGVMDNNSRQWLRRAGKGSNGSNANEWHAMDATTQLQFWVTDSSLHLPSTSKAHMLGFYDVLAFVSEEEWAAQSQLSEQDESTRGRSPFARYLCKWKGKVWAAEKRRDLAAVLSVRYKWADKSYEAIFYDDEAVDLHSPFAKEVEAANK